MKANKKRAIALLLCCFAMIFLFLSCEGKKNAEEADASSAEAAASSVTETVAQSKDNKESDKGDVLFPNDLPVIWE